MIYLDNAATSYLRPSCVKEAVADAIDRFGNPSRGAYAASLLGDRCLFETRLALAGLFGADGPDCVSFTMNASQALNTAIGGAGLGPGDHLIVSLQEHNSVLRPAYRLRDRGVILHLVGLTPEGLFDIDRYEGILRRIRGKEMFGGAETGPGSQTGQTGEKIVTALAHGSNVTGNVIDLKAVSRLCRTYGSLLIVDAAQTAGILPISMKEDGIDILCMSGHKALMGPQGTGALLVRRGIPIDPLMVGGSGVKTFLETMPQEMPARLEAGTQNAHSIAGLLAALRYGDGRREDWTRKEAGLRARALAGIRTLNRRAGRDVIHVYGNPDAEVCLPTLSFNVEGMEAGQVADRLWEEKEIAVRAGGHCAPLIHTFFGTERRGIVRASFSHYNQEEDVAALVSVLSELVCEADRSSGREAGDEKTGASGQNRRIRAERAEDKHPGPSTTARQV